MTGEMSRSPEVLDRSLVAVLPSPRQFNNIPSFVDVFSPTGRSLLGFDPVAVYSFLIFNAFVFYLIYIAVADRKDRLHWKRQAQLLREKLSHRLDKELLAVLPDDQLHKAVVHLRKTEFKMKYGYLHHDHHSHKQNVTQQEPMTMTTTTPRPMVDTESIVEVPTPFMEVTTKSPMGGSRDQIMAFTSQPVTSPGAESLNQAMQMMPWRYSAFQPSLAVQQGWNSDWKKLREAGNGVILGDQRAESVITNDGQLPELAQKYGIIVLRHRGASNHDQDQRALSWRLPTVS